ncbi:hypothetical protein RN001_007850 [Aquatica leii]|uniref:CRAL-TRIO domain-containing protein n=1 Tax=Aquatica leii TaxID=1421715 RepID=A0AAN7SH05_9COLE|nr:hypothetical protein RN001_007850 [Aquatica leii]
MCAAHLQIVSPSDIQGTLLNLKTLLRDDSVLQQYDFDDSFLTRFLYSTRFHVASALQKIQEYHFVLIHNPKWFGFSDTVRINHEDINNKAFINGCDKVGRRILLIKLGKLNVRQTSAEQQAFLFNILLEKANFDVLTLQHGFCMIIDVSGFPWKLAQWLTLNNLKMGTKLIENYPIKEVIVHIVNKSYLLQCSINIVWPLLSDHTKELIKFHFTDWESLHEYIDPKILPKEYGGTGPELDFEKTENDVLKNIDYLTKTIRENMCLRNV